ARPNKTPRGSVSDGDRHSMAAHRQVLTPLRHMRDHPFMARLRAPLDWPGAPDLVNQTAASPYLTTALAAAYCGYRTTGAIRKLVKEGKLVPISRRNGNGTLIFLRTDLDDFMRGRTLGVGRPSTPPHGGTDESVDLSMENLDRADEAHRSVAQK